MAEKTRVVKTKINNSAIDEVMREAGYSTEVRMLERQLQVKLLQYITQLLPAELKRATQYSTVGFGHSRLRLVAYVNLHGRFTKIYKTRETMRRAILNLGGNLDSARVRD